MRQLVIAMFGKYPWQNTDDWVEGINRCVDWHEAQQVIDEFAE